MVGGVGALVVTMVAGGARADEEAAPPARGFGMTLRGVAGYPFVAGASIGAEVHASPSVALEVAMGGYGALEKNRDEGGTEVMLGLRYLFAPESPRPRLYLMGGPHLRAVAGTFGGDVSVSRTFLGAYGGVGLDVPLGGAFAARGEIVGSATPRLAISEPDQGDSVRAQVRLQLGVSAYF